MQFVACISFISSSYSGFVSNVRISLMPVLSLARNSYLDCDSCINRCNFTFTDTNEYATCKSYCTEYNHNSCPFENGRTGCHESVGTEYNSTYTHDVCKVLCPRVSGTALAIIIPCMVLLLVSLVLVPVCWSTKCCSTCRKRNYYSPRNDTDSPTNTYGTNVEIVTTDQGTQAIPALSSIQHTYGSYQRLPDAPPISIVFPQSRSLNYLSTPSHSPAPSPVPVLPAQIDADKTEVNSSGSIN